jgi:hypothetical protein
MWGKDFVAPLNKSSTHDYKISTLANEAGSEVHINKQNKTL